jgi:hypothetical protein
LTPKKRAKAFEDFARDFEQKIINGATMDGHKVTLAEFSVKMARRIRKPKLQANTVEK